MLIVFYTNCQYAGIQFFLARYYATQGRSVRFKHIQNDTLIRDRGLIDLEVLKRADAFIYQPIDATHGCYSTDPTVEKNILSHLGSQCRRIAFPHIYNSAFWPFIPPEAIDNVVGGFGLIDQYINEEPIGELVDKGWALKEILRAFAKNRIDFKYRQRYDKCLQVLRQKEQICDVVVSDFIDANVRTQRLFLTQNHPTTALFVHCCNQILLLLGEDYAFDANDFPENVAGFFKGWPYSDSAQEAWGFNYRVKHKENKFYRKHITRMYRRHLLSHIHPLSYSIPEECIADQVVEKKRMFGELIPGKAATYIYKEKASYYQMYQEALFGFTYCKGGWDCLRHYEIIANKCIPYFVGIEDCPDLTMGRLPKALIQKAMKEVDEGRLSPERYRDYVEQLSAHARQHMTCRSSAESVIEIMRNRRTDQSPEVDSTSARVLMINVGRLNYSRELLTVGFRTLLGSRFTDYPRNEHVYSGEAFTYTNLIHDDGVDRTKLKARLKRREFDFVIIGSLDAPMKKKLSQIPLWASLRKYYGRDRIAFLFGGDRSPFEGAGMSEPGPALQECLEYGVCFVREFGDSNAAINEAPRWSEYISMRRNNYEANIEEVDKIAASLSLDHPFKV